MQAIPADRSVNTRFSKDSASLSVVLLSLGSRTELERAVSVLSPSIRRFGAQLVVARAEDGAAPPSARENLTFSYVQAPQGASRADLCELGMAAATGDIVALRDDASVRDSEWMEAFSATVGRGETLVADHDRFPTPVRSDAVDAPARPLFVSPAAEQRADPRKVVGRDA